MSNITHGGKRKAKNTWLSGKIKCGLIDIYVAGNALTLKAVRVAGRCGYLILNNPYMTKCTARCPTSKR
jgi:hypothetical protein